MPVNLQSKIALTVLGRLFRADIKVHLEEGALQYDWKDLLASWHTDNPSGESGCSMWWSLPLRLQRCLAEFWMAARSCPSSCSTWAQSLVRLANRARLYFHVGSLQGMDTITKPTAAPCRAELMFPPGFSTLQPTDQWRLLSFSPNYTQRFGISKHRVSS